MKEKHLSDAKRFLLTLLATTFSIILTFGTSAIIERRHKAAAKKEMAMMIIYDFDKTLEQMQHADSLFYQAFKAQQEVVLHPELFDSKRSSYMSVFSLIYTEFSETTEKVFSSNIETFNTLGNANFVHEVSAFYNMRHSYQETVLDVFKKNASGSEINQSIEKLLKFDFPEYYFHSRLCLLAMQKMRNRCAQMMKVSEEDLKEFSRLRAVVEDDSEEYDLELKQLSDEYLEAIIIVGQAQKKLEQEKQTIK